MTFKERIYKEKGNLTKMFLYYDKGLFFNLVEHSAYAFHTRIKPFKVHVKTLKGLDAPYVTLGFPVSKKDDYLKNLSINDDGQGCITVSLEEPINENAFQAWKKHVIEKDMHEKGLTQQPPVIIHDVACEDMADKKDDENRLLVNQYFLEVQSLNLAAMTPMEAMLFLNNLQIKLKNVTL